MGGGRGGGSGMMGGGGLGGGMGMMGNMGGGGGMLGNMGGGGPGVTPQLLQQLGVDGPVTNTVFVSNVSITVQRSPTPSQCNKNFMKCRIELKENFVLSIKFTMINALCIFSLFIRLWKISEFFLVFELKSA